MTEDAGPVVGTGRGSPTFSECFRFPLSSPEAKRDILIGGLLVMFTGPIGFILCMGHRLHVLHRLARDERPVFYGFRPFWFTFRRGLSAVTAIVSYLSPGAVLILLGLFGLSSTPLLRLAVLGIGIPLLILGLYALPGGMTHNAIHDDVGVLTRPFQALAIAREGGRPYLKAWVIGWTAVGISYASLLVFVVPFFFVSVWAWSAAGYAFTKALMGTPE